MPLNLTDKESAERVLRTTLEIAKRGFAHIVLHAPDDKTSDYARQHWNHIRDLLK